MLEGTGLEIFDMLIRFVGEKGVFPNPHAFWKKIVVQQNKYPVSRGCFDYWWMKFQIAGLVRVEPVTKAYRIHNVRVEVEKLL
jgi:hypothetical protein